MLNIVWLAVFAAAGIGIGFLYNFLVIKKYPENKRKLGYVLTVFVFFLTAAALYSIFSVKAGVNSLITEKSNKLEQDIREKNPGNSFIKNGVDLVAVNNDISKLTNTVSDLRELLPSSAELGIDNFKFFYDLAVDNAMSKLPKKLASLDFSGKKTVPFVDENNFLTLSSIINGLRKNILNIVNVVFLVLASIFILIFLIHIIRSLAVVKNGGKT
jgi:hypothetical protein